MKFSKEEIADLKRSSGELATDIGHEKLEIDEAITFRLDGMTKKKKASIRSRVSFYGAKTGKKFITRHAEKEGINYFLVIRTE